MCLSGDVQLWSYVDLTRAICAGIARYGFEVEFTRLERPKTGVFDGLKIVVDPSLSNELQAFILLHLFGHSIQWVAPSLAPITDKLQNTVALEEFIVVLRAYEYEAARLGLQLLHECGVSQLDAWYSNCVATDWAYVERYYRTGHIATWEECRTIAVAVVEPMPIPTINRRQVEVRFAF
jgi:hypothetical protein